MGWASGMQAGLQLGKAFKEGQERRAMEKIQGATANEFQDYGTAGTQQIQGLQASGAYDVQAIPGAEGQAPTLRYMPRQGLDLQGDMPAPAGAYIDVAPQRMTEYLGQRYEGGLAPERMETIRTRAMANAMTDPARRQQALLAVTGEERAQDAELRAKAAELRTQVTADQQASKFATDSTVAGLNINRLTREEAASQDEVARQKANAEWWISQTTDPETGKRRAPRPEDWLAASQRDAASYLEKGDYTKGGQAFDAFMNRAESLILKDEKERTRDAQKAFDAFNTSRSDESLKLGLELYNKHLPNGSKATSAKLDSKGMIVMSHTDLSGNKLPDTKVTPEQYMQGLASFGDSKAAINFVRESFRDSLAVKESNQRSRGLDLQERNVVVNEDTAQSNKISNVQRDAREAKKANQPTPQTVKQYKDATTGKSVLVDVSRLEVGTDGVLKTPEGLVPVNARTEPTDAAVVRQATEIMNDRRNFKMVNGKPVPPTMAEATAMAKANLRKQSAADGSGDDTDRIIRLMEAARAGNAVDSGLD